MAHSRPPTHPPHLSIYVEGAPDTPKSPTPPRIVSRPAVSLLIGQLLNKDPIKKPLSREAGGRLNMWAEAGCAPPAHWFCLYSVPRNTFHEHLSPQKPFLSIINY